MRTLVLVGLGLCLVGLSACSQDDWVSRHAFTLGGALVGGGVGYGLSDHRWGGTVGGMAAGALLGYVIDELRAQNEQPAPAPAPAPKSAPPGGP